MKDAIAAKTAPMRGTELQWLTTTPHPTKPAHTHGADAGQTGWKLHLVETGQSTRTRHVRSHPAIIDVSSALCGLRPAHGWGLDLFIADECMRCIKAAEKRGISLPESLK